MNIFLLLFLEFFKMGALTFGGGYAMIPFIEETVLRHGWMTTSELVDFIAVSESTPGAFAVNISTYIGSEVGGIIGALLATLGLVLPPFLIMLLVTYFYTFVSTNPYVRLFIDGMQAGVCAMLLDIMLGLFRTVAKRNHIVYYLLIVISFLYVRLTKYSIFYLAVFCVIVAIIKAMVSRQEVKRHD